MAKAILLSIRPNWVKMILSKEKTFEIRRQFPKDFVGWVYIYCTKDKNNLLHKNCADIWWVEDKDFQKKNKRLGIEQQPIYNGKVIARFWCDKVEEIRTIDYGEQIFTDTLSEEELCKKSCLKNWELDSYLHPSKYQGYAINISKLEIFVEPKELGEFYTINKAKSCSKSGCPYASKCSIHFRLSQAPQNYCYVEI